MTIKLTEAVPRRFRTKIAGRFPHVGVNLLLVRRRYI